MLVYVEILGVDVLAFKGRINDWTLKIHKKESKIIQNETYFKDRDINDDYKSLVY